MNNLQIGTMHLPPDVQELIDTIITGVVALASRMNSNSDSNSLGGTNFCIYFGHFCAQNERRT